MTACELLPAHRKRLRAWLLASTILLAATALAQSNITQAVLERLPPTQRSLLLAQQQRWQALPAAQQQALRQRHAQWQALPLQQRQQLRDAWQARQQLTAFEQQSMREAAVQRATLAPDEQAAWRAQFDALNSSEQHGWLLGPELGRDWPRLQPLFAQVPPEQREPLLVVLRQLDRQQRQGLGVIAQRTPPQARDELRQELLQTAPAQRAQWLRMRLGG